MKLVQCLLIGALVGACPGPDTKQYGTIKVAVDCAGSQLMWAREAVTGLDSLGGPQWLLADIGEAHDATVMCESLDRGTLGQWAEGSSVVSVDPFQVNDPNVMHAVVGHELVHLVLGHGPHPSYGRLHLCRLVNELPSGECWGGRYGVALMNPFARVNGLDTFTGNGLYASEPTWMDGEFIREGLTP